MSAVKINIDNVKSGGSMNIMNNMNVSNSDVDVNIKDVKSDKKSSVMNNLEVQNGKLNVDVDGMNLGPNSSFMDNKHINREEVKVSHGNTSRSDISTEMIPISDIKKKEGFFRKVLNLFRKRKDSGEIFIEEETTSSIPKKSRRHEDDFVKLLTGYDKIEIDHTVLDKEKEDNSRTIEEELDDSLSH